MRRDSPRRLALAAAAGGSPPASRSASRSRSSCRAPGAIAGRGCRARRARSRSPRSPPRSPRRRPPRSRSAATAVGAASRRSAAARAAAGARSRSRLAAGNELLADGRRRATRSSSWSPTRASARTSRTTSPRRAAAVPYEKLFVVAARARRSRRAWACCSGPSTQRADASAALDVAARRRCASSGPTCARIDSRARRRAPRRAPTRRPVRIRRFRRDFPREFVGDFDLRFPPENAIKNARGGSVHKTNTYEIFLDAVESMRGVHRRWHWRWRGCGPRPLAQSDSHIEATPPHPPPQPHRIASPPRCAPSRCRRRPRRAKREITLLGRRRQPAGARGAARDGARDARQLRHPPRHRGHRQPQRHRPDAEADPHAHRAAGRHALGDGRARPSRSCPTRRTCATTASTT